MRRSSWVVFLISVGLGAALTTCVRTTIPAPALPPSPPPSLNVPAGCLELQAGEFQYENDATFTYSADDDGGELTLVVRHVEVIDAGFVPRVFRRDAGVDAGLRDAGSPDAGLDAGLTDDDAPEGPRIVLRRTDAGFVGETLAQVRHPSGRVCALRFATRVLSCDGGLWLESLDSAAVGDGCQAPANPAAPTARQHHLLRLGIDAPRDH